MSVTNSSGKNGNLFLSKGDPLLYTHVASGLAYNDMKTKEMDNPWQLV